MQIESFQKKFCTDIAALHVRGIPTGFISSLDLNFVTALYHALTQSNRAFGFVIREKNRTLGFIAFTANKLYQKFGFQLVCRIQSHNVPSNIYVKSLTQERSQGVVLILMYWIYFLRI